jgi:uncharacterized protein
MRFASRASGQERIDMKFIDVERRDRPASGNVEFRAAASGEARLGGYAATFNSPTMIGGSFREQIAPGAFTASIAQNDIRMLYNHDQNFLLGRTASGTLTLSEDPVGLRFDLNPPNTSAGCDVVESIKRGDLGGCSFAFQATREMWDDSGDVPLRTLLEVDLLECSICVWPAYRDTSVVVRSAHASSPFREIPPAAVTAALARMKQGIVERERPYHACH